MEPGRAKRADSSSSGTDDVLLRETVTEPPMVREIGWFFSPLWSPRSRARQWKFRPDLNSEHVEAWLDDHSDFTGDYFLPRASPLSGSRLDVSPLPTIPRSSSDLSELLRKSPQRRTSAPLTSPHLRVNSLRDPPQTSVLNLSTPDVTGYHSPCSPRSSHSCFSPCRSLSPNYPCSPDIPLSPHLLQSAISKPAACGQGEGCPWMSALLGGGLSWMGSVTELCQEALLHTGELLAAEGGSVSLAKKQNDGKITLESLIPLTLLDYLNERSLCSDAHVEVMKSVMRCVLATGAPVNLRDVSEDSEFDSDVSTASKIRDVLSVPIKNHRGEVIGVVAMMNKKGLDDGSESIFTKLDEKVLSYHMDVLGMVLDNFLLYECSRQEAKRSQALLEMAHLLSKEHSSLEALLSKMAATIMPFTCAQFCTIFIPNTKTPDSKDQISFCEVVHLECEDLGSTCQIYRRERDISDLNSHYALQTLVTMETLNVTQSSDESMKTLICCPVKNESSNTVIAVCQLMNKGLTQSSKSEAFNKYDQRLLQDLAVYCGLALQYVQAVQITEERRASIEVTQEVLAYHITAAEQEIQALQEASIPSSESLEILDFNFSDFGLPDDVTSQAIVRMFLDLNLVQDFNIDYKSLCQWVLTVKRGYRNNVPYHNWSHALSTAQSMFAMLKATDQFQTIFSNLEILGLMIATLNHDIDHRGVSNSYIERSHQPLAQLYGHSSLENHHYNLCLFILNNTGSQILSGLTAQEHRTILYMIKRAILATDLSVYMERRDDFFSLSKKGRVNWNSEKQRELLRSMLMTASDLSAISKPWLEQKRISNLVAMEFFAQGDKEKKEFNIEPIDIMNRENSSRLPNMQVEYIDEICYPLYKALSRLFGSCSPLLNGCKKNREHWLHLAKEEEDCDLKSPMQTNTNENENT